MKVSLDIFAPALIFSLKLLFAGIIAYLIAFSVDVSNPLWASAAACSACQYFSGSTRIKALFSGLGVMLGALSSLVLGYFFYDSSYVLIFVTSLLLSIYFYLSVVERLTWRYLYTLAGITTALVTFSTIDRPEMLFDVALSRAVETVIGISVASLITIILFPTRIESEFNQTVLELNQHTNNLFVDLFENNDWVLMEDKLRIICGKITKLENQTLHYQYEKNQDKNVLVEVERLIRLVLLMIPYIYVISKYLESFQKIVGLREKVLGKTEELCEYLRSADSYDKRTIQKIFLSINIGQNRTNISLLELAETQFYQILNDSCMLVCELTLIREKLILADSLNDLEINNANNINFGLMHYDKHRKALFCTLVFIVSLTICDVLWIYSGLNIGWLAALMVAETGFLFGWMEEAAESVFKHVKWTCLTTLLMGLSLFFLFPMIHTLETFVIIMGPVIVLFGIISAINQMKEAGASVAALSPSWIVWALERSYTYDESVFLNGSVAIIGGQIIFAIVAAQISPFIQWAVQMDYHASLADGLSKIFKLDISRDRPLIDQNHLDALYLLPSLVVPSKIDIGNGLRDLTSAYFKIKIRALNIKHSEKKAISDLTTILLKIYSKDLKSNEAHNLCKDIDKLLAFFIKKSDYEVCQYILNIRIIFFKEIPEVEYEA